MINLCFIALKSIWWQFFCQIMIKNVFFLILFFKVIIWKRESRLVLVFLIPLLPSKIFNKYKLIFTKSDQLMMRQIVNVCFWNIRLYHVSYGIDYWQNSFSVRLKIYFHLIYCFFSQCLKTSEILKNSLILLLCASSVIQNTIVYNFFSRISFRIFYSSRVIYIHFLKYCHLVLKSSIHFQLSNLNLFIMRS